MLTFLYILWHVLVWWCLLRFNESLSMARRMPLVVFVVCGEPGCLRCGWHIPEDGGVSSTCGLKGLAVV